MNAVAGNELLDASPGLMRLHVGADGAIALGCFMIAATLAWFVRRNSTPLSFSWALILFAALFALFGLEQLLDLTTFWNPIHFLHGYWKALTALVAMATAIAIIPLVPKLLAIRLPEELAEARQRMREEQASREMAEEDLRRAQADRDRALRELEQFAYITSHDLQAPLRTISGFSQLLIRRNRAQLDGDALEFLDFIDKGSRQMQSLIQDLLALSRVGRAADTVLERRPLADSLSKALRELQEPIDQSGAEIAFGTLPEIQAYHGLLQQMFQSLIGNAIKFRRPDTRPHIGITIDRVADNWELVVADNGIGIPQDQLEAIFTTFRRLHPPEKYEGTGIGLAICRKIAAQHGGEIRASSDDSGAQFHIRLPVSPPTERRLSAPRLKPTDV